MNPATVHTFVKSISRRSIRFRFLAIKSLLRLLCLPPPEHVVVIQSSHVHFDSDDLIAQELQVLLCCLLRSASHWSARQEQGHVYSEHEGLSLLCDNLFIICHNNILLLVGGGRVASNVTDGIEENMPMHELQLCLWCGSRVASIAAPRELLLLLILIVTYAPSSPELLPD